jgi:hypothetical protein
MSEPKSKWVVRVVESSYNFQKLIREQYEDGYVLHSWALVGREYSAVFVHDSRLKGRP